MSAFGWVVGLGAVVGLLMALRRALPNERAALVEAATWAALGVVVGGHLAYALAHPGAYWHRPWGALMPWEGGSAWPGAVAGYSLGLAWAARRLGRPWRTLSDALLPFAAMLALTAWLGCAMEGCAYGPQVPWGMPLPDEGGRVAPRWPVQALGLLLSGSVWLAAERAADPRRPGRATGIAYLGGGLVMLATAALCADPRPWWGPLPAEAWAALAWSLSGLLLLWHTPTPSS